MRTYRPFSLATVGQGVARKLACVVVAGVTSAALPPGAASGEPISLFGEQSPVRTSSFSLDFGALGGVSSARIAQTQFALEIDADQGLARFENYNQQVEPLTLPGGFNTGNIRVEVVPGSSNGTFNDLTGEFETSELYAVHFDGDLSAFQLTSPVILPSTSAGVVTVQALEGGNVNLEWSGVSELLNPFDPSSFIQFTYTCSVDASFSPEPTTLVRLALVPDVINLELSAGLESSLLSKLDVALQNVLTGNNRAAANNLTAFVRQIQAQRGDKLDEDAADLLISDAQGAIFMLRSGVVAASREVPATPLGKESR
jgi:hypothetical protein